MSSGKRMCTRRSNVFRPAPSSPSVTIYFFPIFVYISLYILPSQVVVQAEALESDTAASEALGAVVARLACMDPALGAAVVAEVRRRCPPAAPEVSRAAPGTDSFR